MSRPLPRVALFALTGLGLLLLAFLALRSRPAQTGPTRPANPTATTAPSLPPAAAPPSPPAAEPQLPTLADFTTLIAQTLAALQTGNDPTHAAALARLRRDLWSGDPAVAVAAIRAFLATGQDASTGEDFTVGPGGILTESPSLRVLLLDQLGSLAAAAGSPDGIEAARDLLSRHDSADEWAVALRNIAWADPGARDFLHDKSADLLAYQPWRDQPSGGYLEAFDAIVYTDSLDLLPTLATLLATPTGPLPRAAGVALDRLAETAPLGVMQILNADPTLFADRPGLRADYFAKADPADPAQRAQIETYLQRSDVTPSEQETFLDALVSPGHFVSDNLLTPNLPAPDPALHRAAVLTLDTSWRQSGQFPRLQPILQTLLARTAPR